MRVIEKCSTCDLVLGRWRRCPNYWCRRADRGWDVVWAAGEHRGRLKRAIAELKYRGDRAWVAPLAGLLVSYLLERAPDFEQVDLVVPVPSNVGRARPVDHVGLVLAAAAPAIGDLWRLATSGGVLAKRGETSPLAAAPSSMVRRLRAATEVRPALVVTDPDAVLGRRVLAVDDVFTDGSTLREVALALRGAGAVSVSGLVLARQPVHPPHVS
jgi:predicted amidophosphoribosyltransferase